MKLNGSVEILSKKCRAGLQACDFARLKPCPTGGFYAHNGKGTRDFNRDRLNLILILSFFFLLIFPLSPYAEVTLDISQEPGRSIITLRAEADIERYQTIKLEEPPRLIADLLGLPLPREAKTFPGIPGLIKEMSLGPFRDRVRLVMVFDTPKLPPYAVAVKGKELLISVLGPTAERPPALPEAPPTKVYVGRRVTLDFVDVEITTLFRLLSEVSGLNIVSGPDVKGRVTIRLVNLPWDRALEIILTANKLEQERVGNVIRVATAKTFKEEREAKIKEAEAEEARRIEKERRERELARQLARAERKAALELEELVTKNVFLSYTDAADLAKRLEPLKSDRPGASITPVTKTRSILIKDLKRNVDAMLKLIEQIDIPTPQVLIEARVVEIQTAFLRDLGVQWAFRSAERGGSFSIGGGLGVATAGVDVGRGVAANVPAFLLPSIPPGTTIPVSGTNVVVNLPATVAPGLGSALGLTIGRISDVFGLDLRISALQADSKLTILSSPKVLTTDNKEAEIRQGAEVPFSIATATGPVTQFENVELALKVKPIITPDGTILLRVELTNDSLGPPSAGPGTPPIINQQRASTDILMMDGETVVIGGILQKGETETITGIPGLMRIPILGWLFKRQTRTNLQPDREVLLFITTRIVPLERPTARSG